MWSWWKLQRQDEIDRIAVEGKFGQGKRRFSLARVMMKLAQTSEVSIMITFIVMNLEKILTGVLSFLLFVWRWLWAKLRPNDRRDENPIPADLTVAAWICWSQVENNRKLFQQALLRMLDLDYSQGNRQLHGEISKDSSIELRLQFSLSNKANFCTCVKFNYLNSKKCHQMNFCLLRGCD